MIRTGTTCQLAQLCQLRGTTDPRPRNRHNVPTGTTVPTSGHYGPAPPEPAQRANWHSCANFEAPGPTPPEPAQRANWHSWANFGALRARAPGTGTTCQLAQLCQIRGTRAHAPGTRASHNLNSSWISDYRLIERHSPVNGRRALWAARTASPPEAGDSCVGTTCTTRCALHTRTAACLRPRVRATQSACHPARHGLMAGS